MADFDLAVIGGGPGGYTAAVRAGQLGMKVALVEKSELGGVCLNAGCIPTKTLLAGASLLREFRRAGAFGIDFAGEATPDWPKMRQRKDAVIGKLRAGVAFLLQSAGVTVFKGTASFRDAGSIRLDGGEIITAESFLIATGSEPAMPAGLPDSPRIVSSTGILELDRIPERLLILGGGVIGCEFASLFAALGSRVVLVEMQPDILGSFDGDLVKMLRRRFRADGVKIFTGQASGAVAAGADGVAVELAGKTLDADVLLAAVGRRPVSAGLALDQAGVAVGRRGEIPVDAGFCTNVPHIFAVGDVTGKIMLAHYASASAVALVERLNGMDVHFKPEYTPGVVYTSPEIGSAGLSEEECVRRSLAVRIGKCSFAALGRAAASGDTEGLAKVIADAATDRVLGIHIVGAHASELIAEAGPVLAAGLTARELGGIVHAHPTLGEAVMEAANAVHDAAIAVPARPAHGREA
jgi:dihydrolipoamide dehydrogenase